jgi:DNA repair protein RadA/Sms
VPKANAPKQPIKGMQVFAVERLEQALNKVRDL